MKRLMILMQTIRAELCRALGRDPHRCENGLRALAGSWSEAEFQSFERATACFEKIDENV